MHPDFTDEEEVWMKIFKTAMYRALDMTNLEVAIEATQVRHQSQIEETFECPECGELVPESQWSPAKAICRRCYAKAYYEANKEKLNAYSKAYYEVNKEKRIAYSKAYYEANKEKLEKIKAYKKAYMKAYREAKKKEAENPKKQTNATQTNNPSNEIQNHPRKRKN